MATTLIPEANHMIDGQQGFGRVGTQKRKAIHGKHRAIDTGNTFALTQGTFSKIMAGMALRGTL